MLKKVSFSPISHGFVGQSAHSVWGSKTNASGIEPSVVSR